MDKIEKLLRKISQKDRQRIFRIIDNLFTGQKADLNIVKIKNSNFYRIKSGNFRIIFHYESDRAKIDYIELRNEKTYKGL